MIAAALKEALKRAQPGTLPSNGVYDAAESLADALARDNPRFDRERFLKAAGVGA